MEFKNKIANILNENIKDLSIEEIEASLEVPKQKSMGDYAFPCFKLAKTMKKAPNLIAEEIANKIDNSLFEEIKVMGAYINFKLNKSVFARELFDALSKQGEDFGNTNIGNGDTIIVEFCSANIAKPFHIGHLRSTMIGSSLYRIYKALGYNAVAINHLGDYGTQFGKLISAYKHWGNKEDIEKDPIQQFLDLYVKFHEEAETKPELEDEARAYFVQLEAGDEEVTKLWQWIRELSLAEFMKIFKALDVSFDSYKGEAFYSDKMDEVLDILSEKNITTQEESGARIVDLSSYDMPNALITKSDGSTLYITRDLAAAIYRIREYAFKKNIYVVAYQQDLHFKQVFKILELMGFEDAKNCEHVNFGMVSLEEGTLSTRKGRVVTLESVLQRAKEMSLKVIEEKSPELENKEEVAEMIGYGAIVFQDLFNQRVKDYTFSWEKALSFEGESAPYVQYAHARCNAILEKANIEIDYNLNYDLLSDEESQDLIKSLLDFPNVILSAMNFNEPSKITRYTVDLAGEFNKFYHANHINVDDEELKKARVMLSFATKQVLKKALYLIGVKAPDKM